MKKTTLTLVFCAAFALASGRAEPLQPLPFKDGTRHAAVGDSITHAGTYVLYLQLYAMTRFPDRAIDFFNAGLSGDSAGGGFLRAGWDILPIKPNSASLMFGMNDVGRDLFKPGLADADLDAKRKERIDNFDRNTRSLLKVLQAGKIPVILVTPSIFDETSTMATPNAPGVDSIALAECTNRIFQMAKEFSLPVVDFHGPMLEINREQQKKDPAFTIIGKDRVHPGTAGHLVMAWRFLKDTGVTGDVASLSIDAANGKVTAASNCSVDEIQPATGSIRFRYTANALPFPIEDAAKPALDWAPINDDLNREILQVKNLPAGNYRFEIDGEPIRNISAEELAKGINLALEPRTPQYRQAQEVLRQLKDYWKIVGTLRDIVVVEYGTMGRDFPRPLTFEQVKSKLDERLSKLTGNPSESYHRRVAEVWMQNKPKEEELKKQATDLLPKIREAAQPRPHMVSVKPVQP